MSDADPGSLLVFSDDWGRHPSSCQHLVSELLPELPVWWVNTIGTRRPRLDAATLQRGREKLGHWFGGEQNHTTLPAGLTVVNPAMWPWLTRRHDRWLNRRLLQRSLGPVVAQMPRPIVGLTTLPVVAPMMDAIQADRWVYYCVDDFSAWPGLDQSSMQTLEVDLLAQCDAVVAASTPLCDRLASLGHPSQLVTHGVHLEHWTQNGAAAALEALGGLERPLVVFWGVVDQRMDHEFVAETARQLQSGTILLVGPQQSPDEALFDSPRVVSLPPMPYEKLPSLASAAEVLIMPYIDAPVTRQMQPLKLKEYLATGKPTVVRDLPASREWADCLDLAQDARQFASLVCERIAGGLPEEQVVGRRRLSGESWRAKLDQFIQVLRP